MYVSFHHILRYKMKLQSTCMILLGEVVRHRGRKEEKQLLLMILILVVMPGRRWDRREGECVRAHTHHVRRGRCGHSVSGDM